MDGDHDDLILTVMSAKYTHIYIINICHILAVLRLNIDFHVLVDSTQIASAHKLRSLSNNGVVSCQIR